MRLYNFKRGSGTVEFMLGGISDISEVRPLFGNSWGAYRATNEELLFDKSKDYDEYYYHFEGIKWPIFGPSYVIDVHLNKNEKKAHVKIMGWNSTLADILDTIGANN